MPARVCEEAGAAALGNARRLGMRPWVLQRYLVVNDGVVDYILLSYKRAFSRGGEYLGESFAPTLMSVSIMTASTDAVPLLQASSWDFCFLPMRMVRALRVKTQVSASPSGR
jgi:hypothetical protein